MFRMRYMEVSNPGNEKWWKRYLVDLMLAFIVGLLLIYLILAHSLHLRVSTILLGYLFIVLYLAYTRGLRTAIIAAFIGCAAFDFLFVPPVFSISVSQVEDGWEMLI